jgi:hypothetical protein
LKCYILQGTKFIFCLGEFQEHLTALLMIIHKLYSVTAAHYKINYQLMAHLTDLTFKLSLLHSINLHIKQVKNSVLVKMDYLPAVGDPYLRKKKCKAKT